MSSNLGASPERRRRAARAAIVGLALATAGALLAAGSSALAGTVTGTITPGGDPLTVTISTPGDNAAITFSGTAGQRVSLSLTGVTLNWATDAIKKPDGTTLTSKAIFPSSGFIDVQTLATTGTYTISIQPNNNATGSQTLRLYDVPANPSGTITPGGSSVTATTTTPGQNGSYTFSGTAGQRVSLHITGVSLSSPTSCCPTETVSILKPGGTTLASQGAIGGAGGFIDTQTLPTTGTYTVLVDPQSDAYGSSTLTLYDVPADVSGPITPSGSGGMATPSTTTPGQNVGLTFTGTQGQRVSLKISGVSLSDPNLYEIVSIKKPDGTTLAGSGAVTSSGWIDTQTLPTNGTYTVFVDPYKSATAATTLTLYDVPPDFSGELALNGDAAAEATSVPGQDARFTFTASAGQTVYLVRGGATTPLSIIKILNPDGSVVSSLTTPPVDGSQTANLPVTGTYTAIVDGYQDAIGKMTLALSDEDDSVGDLSLDQGANTQADADPAPASPVPVSPSGPVPPGSYATETWDGDEVGNETGLNVVTTTSAGSFALTGIVKADNTQLPLSGATVTVLQSGVSVASTTTDSDGAFAFLDLPALTYDLTVVPPGPYLTAQHLNNAAEADEVYEQTVEVSSVTAFTVDHSSAGISRNPVTPTSPGTAFSRTRIPPFIRVRILDIYPPGSFVGGEPVNCKQKPDQPANPPVKTYRFRYYIQRVAMEETGTTISYNDVGAKALLAVVQNFSWLHATIPGPWDVVNASNVYAGQCFRDGTNVKKRFRDGINDVLDELVVGPTGQLLETQHRAGRFACNDPDNPAGGNIASQQGIDALTKLEECPKRTNWRDAVTYYFASGTAVVPGRKPLPPTATAFSAPELGGLRFNVASRVFGLPVGWRYEISKILAPNLYKHLAYVAQGSRGAAAAWTYPGSEAAGCFRYRARAKNPVGWSPWANVNKGLPVCYP